MLDSAVEASRECYHLSYVTDKAKKASRKALQRWEGEGGATAEGPQQSGGKERPRDANEFAKHIKIGRKHRPYPQGGKPNPDAPPEKLPEKAPNKSWQPGRPGQGGEGLSKGYGGAGDPEGPSGPEEESDRPKKERK